MRNDRIPVPLLSQISPRAIEEYALSTGWKLGAGTDEEVALFRKPQDELTEVLVPRSSHFADFHDRLADAILLLAAVEVREPVAVLNDLLFPPADVIRYHLNETETELGVLPLEHCIPFFNSCLQSLRAVARAEEAPAPFHSKLSGKQTDEFFGSCRLGQTERGSFVVNILCPLELAKMQGGGDQDRLVLQDIGNSFGRRTTHRLMRSAYKLVEAIRANDLAPIIRPPANDKVMISANFCEALGEIHTLGQDAALSIRSTWARGTIRPKDVPSRVDIPRDHFPVIIDIARQLRPAEELPQSPFVGKITALRGKPDQNGLMQGGVTLSFQHDEYILRARLNLTPIDYQTAVDAHRKNRFVTISGDFRGDKKTPYIENVRRVAIIGEGASDQEPRLF